MGDSRYRFARLWQVQLHWMGPVTMVAGTPFFFCFTHQLSFHEQPAFGLPHGAFESTDFLEIVTH